MPDTGPAELLPILVSQLDNDEARDYLEGVALAGGAVSLPLVAPPMDRSRHALQVYTPTCKEPLHLLADPMGPPNEHGYPLRLSPRLAAPPPRPAGRASAAPRASGTHKATMAYKDLRAEAQPAQELRAKRNTATTKELTERHTRDLEGKTAAADDPDYLVGRKLAGGKLVIEACAGKGGAGTVYRARHRDLHMDVAVKVMHESFQRDVEFCKRFHAEALSASRLDHPNLTRVYDYGQEPDGLLYIAMEYLDGLSLRDLLDQQKRLPLSRVVRYMIQVCSGLTHAHARNIVHRDIKPENLVLVKGLDDDGNETEIVKLCDFGIAHRATSDTNAAFAGTPEYMSPEQCRGDEPDARSDVYACGIVLYELLAGEVPITGNNLTQILARQQTVDPDPPSRHLPGLDPRVDRLVMRALAKEREARQQTARDLRAELRAIGEEVAIHGGSGYWKELEPQSERVPRVSSPSSASMPKAKSSSGSDGPEWLERGQGYMASIQPSSMLGSQPPGSSGSNKPAAMSYAPPASERTGAAPFLRQLADTTDPARFAALVAPLEPKLLAALKQGQLTTLWALASTLDVVATEGPQTPGTRAAAAARILKVLDDPQLLAPLAERALDYTQDKEGMAAKLLIRAGVSGAYALYSARLKNRDFDSRARFVNVVEQIGAPATPMLVAALDRLESRLQVAGAVGLAEDLLKAVPKAPDDAMGELLARYARSSAASLALLATKVLPKVWEQRCVPLLVALLDHQDEDVWIAAVEGLKALGAVDEHVVRKLEAYVLGRATLRVPMRAAAVEAIVTARPEVMGTARQLLGQAFQATHGTTPDVEDMIVTLARGIIAARGDVTLVAERWRSSTTWLRARLEALLRPDR